MQGHDYDSDPEALAWARAKIQRHLDRYEAYAAKAKTKPGGGNPTWAALARAYRRDLLGQDGCVIASFDERIPALTAALAGDTTAPAAGADPTLGTLLRQDADHHDLVAPIHLAHGAQALDVHIRPTAVAQWRAWCDFVGVGHGIETTDPDGFTHAQGTWRGQRVLLYGHGVPALRHDPS